MTGLGDFEVSVDGRQSPEPFVPGTAGRTMTSDWETHENARSTESLIEQKT